MRISVKKSLDQNLVKIGAKKLFSQHFTIKVHPCQRTHLGDFDAWDVFHRQHSRRAVIRDRHRHNDMCEIFELFAKGRQVVRFLPVIELAH